MTDKYTNLEENYELKKVEDHIEVYKDDKFLFSADNYLEAINELYNM